MRNHLLFVSNNLASISSLIHFKEVGIGLASSFLRPHGFKISPLLHCGPLRPWWAPLWRPLEPLHWLLQMLGALPRSGAPIPLVANDRNPAPIGWPSLGRKSWPRACWRGAERWITGPGGSRQVEGSITSGARAPWQAAGQAGPSASPEAPLTGAQPHYRPARIKASVAKRCH